MINELTALTDPLPHLPLRRRQAQTIRDNAIRHKIVLQNLMTFAILNSLKITSSAQNLWQLRVKAVVSSAHHTIKFDATVTMVHAFILPPPEPNGLTVVKQHVLRVGKKGL